MTITRMARFAITPKSSVEEAAHHLGRNIRSLVVTDDPIVVEVKIVSTGVVALSRCLDIVAEATGWPYAESLLMAAIQSEIEDQEPAVLLVAYTLTEHDRAEMITVDEHDPSRTDNVPVIRIDL